jgi:ribose/xylose/arabinose/galactoside ABC-type transport system permease subunit
MERDRTTSFFVAIIDNLIWVIVIVAFVVFSLLSSRFFTLFNLVNILPRVAALGLLVIGQSFTMTTAHFDLSSESTLGLTAMVGALFVATTSYGGLGIMLPPGFAIVFMILLGLLIGSLNGFMITKLRMNNLVATIAMLILLRGVVWILSPGKSVSFLGPVFDWIGGGVLFTIQAGGRPTGVPVSFFFVLVAFALAHLVTRYTRFGRDMYAIGSNREAAEATGIRTQRVIFFVYVISGACAGIAGLLEAGRGDSVVGGLGQGWIFQVQAAAIIGGISLFGGRGSMVGALGGVLFWGILDSGLSIMKASPYSFNVFRGGLLLVAMMLDALKTRYMRSLSARQLFSRSTIGITDLHNLG